jgi:hypothetical protein
MKSYGLFQTFLKQCRNGKIGKFNYEIVLLSILFYLQATTWRRENRKRGNGLDSLYLETVQYCSRTGSTVQRVGMDGRIGKFNYETVLLSVLFSLQATTWGRENRKRGSGLDSFYFDKVQYCS